MLPMIFTIWKYCKMKIQWDLLVIWCLIFVCTILSFVIVPSWGGLMRCVKEMLYIPLLFWVYKNSYIQIKHLLYVFFIAFVVNLLFVLANGFSFSFIDIWDGEKMASGMSNCVLNVSTMSISKIEGAGAHGIWGNYCSLMVCAALFAYKNNQISLKFLIVVFACTLMNFVMSVSREAFISFAFVVLFYFIANNFNKRKKFRISPKYFLLFIVFIVGLVSIVKKYGDNIAIVQKIIYTQQSVSDMGTEGNVQLRINGWKVFFTSLWYNPIKVLIGYGYNIENYITYLTFDIARDRTSYVSLPESFFVEMIFFGGFFCLLYGIKFWKDLKKIINKIESKTNRLILLGIFWGLLCVNTFSGASIISDLLYSQFLIFLGIIVRDYIGIDNESLVDNSSK